MAIFDAHFHIIDTQFPLVANQGFLPDHYDSQDYLSRVASLGVSGGAIVSGSFQATDQGYLLEALSQLGPGFVGVTQVDPDCSDDLLDSLNQKGVRAVRFNLKRGCVADLNQIKALANRVYQLFGWHSEFYVDAESLASVMDTLEALPAVVIDHLGLQADSSRNLLSLVTKGARVKATGFARLDFEPIQLMQKIHRENPEALMFGTDLPGTRAPKPFQDADLENIQNHFDEDTLARILWQNAVECYRPPSIKK